MILVVSFDVVDGADPVLAARLEDEIAEHLAATHEVARIDDVPPFDAHGYSAELYVESCPPQREVECAFVVGQRAGAAWALGASLRPDADGVLVIHLVDVGAARVVADVGVPLTEEAPAGIARLVTEATSGAFALRDLRATDIAVAGIELEQERILRETNATDLATLEQQEGQPHRETRRIRPDTQRQGRAGQLLVRAGAGYAHGPWRQYYSRTVWRDGETLEPVLAVHSIEAGNGGAGVGEVDVGWGLTPMMEIGVAWSWRASDTFVSVDEDVVDDVPADPVAPTEVPSGTWLAGFRFGGGPLPASRIRPTVAGGLSVWVGRGVEADPPLGRLPPPLQLVGQVLPGVELDVSEAAGLYVRGSVDLPLWGGRVSQDLDGEPTRGQAGRPAPGGGITAGILLRAGPTR